MAKQPFPSGSSKNKDDDSWGKLASDLLGIQFGGPDDDFDLPDEDAPAAKPVAPENTPIPLATSNLKSVVAQPQAEPDLSFPEEDEDEPTPNRGKNVEPVSTVEPVSSEETSVDEREANEPDIWDQLESWNWDEPVKPAPRSHSDPPSGRGGDRPGRRGPGGPPRSSSSGPPGDRDSGRGRSRSRDEERPRPPRETAAPVAEQASSERPPRREERPRRDEAPRPEQRPARQPDSNEQRPPRSASPRSTASVTPDDGFAAGLDDEPKPRRAPAAPSRPAESAVAPPLRKPVPADPGDDDDFAMDLFQELAQDADEAGTEATGDAGESGGEPSDEDRPRRRRRRRRGGRGRRPETVAGQSDMADDPDTEEHDTEEHDTEEHDEDDPLAFASDDDSTSSDGEVDDTSEGTDEEGGEQRRPRRRRRRGRKRPDERPVEGAVVGAAKRSESEEDDDEDEDDDEVRDEPKVRAERVEEEPLAPVNYEGIPTWEEAISYLIRTRGPEPRGRGNGGSRGRGGPPHRR